MTNFDIIVINIYLLAIFTNLIKTKTTTYIYRFFKLLVLVLFVFVIISGVKENIPLFDFLLRMVPLSFLLFVTVQTEIFLIIKKIGFRGSNIFSNTMEDTIKIEIVKAIDYLSENKIGALISFEKSTSLDEFIATAYPVNAQVNRELLSTIFFPNTPLHDGGVIIRSNDIVCAGAYYPPTDRLDVPKSLGSRHRAAIGISEVSDCLTIIVSEQTGKISITVDGYLDYNITKEMLLSYLERHLQN
jgi:diadenylate cyclase